MTPRNKADCNPTILQWAEACLPAGPSSHSIPYAFEGEATRRLTQTVQSLVVLYQGWERANKQSLTDRGLRDGGR